MIKEADVVRFYERVQMQGDFHLVQLLPREGDRKWKDDAASGPGKQRIIHNDVKTWSTWDH